jgi:hypothetical protein
VVWLFDDHLAAGFTINFTETVKPIFKVKLSTMHIPITRRFKRTTTICFQASSPEDRIYGKLCHWAGA